MAGRHRRDRRVRGRQLHELSRGAHVVYYGEFYPDKATVFARLATFDASARWGEALDGVITTITDHSHRQLDADEFAHQD